MTAAIVAQPPALCRGREGFADEVAALAYARDHGTTVNRKLGAYLCPCGMWHLERRRWLL